MTFPLFEKIDVNGEDQSPIYAELKKTADAEGYSGDIRWNFEKFLIAPDGSVQRFAPTVTPEDPSPRRRDRSRAELTESDRAMQSHVGGLEAVAQPVVPRATIRHAPIRLHVSRTRRPVARREARRRPGPCRRRGIDARRPR